MSSTNQTPEAQLAVGRKILTSRPGLRSRLLKHWVSGGTELDGIAGWLFNGLVRAIDEQYYEPDVSTAQREQLKSLCMGNDSAIAWAQSYLARGFPDPGTPFLPMFKRLESLLASGLVQNVHQVACCSGRELAYYARKFQGIHFTGSDCDDELIEFLTTHWSTLPNLNFVLLRMEQQTRVEDPGCDLLVASGGLHYMDEVSLQQFFNRAHVFAKRLYLSQPMDQGYDAIGSRCSTPRRQLSWNHPYPQMLRSAGWQKVESETGLNENYPGLKNFAAFATSAPEDRMSL